MRYAAQNKLKQRTADYKQKVRAYMTAHPNLSQAEVGRHFRKTQAWVSWVLKQ